MDLFACPSPNNNNKKKTYLNLILHKLPLCYSDPLWLAYTEME